MISSAQAWSASELKDGVRFAAEDAILEVCTAAHTLRVTGRRGRSTEHAATRSGLRAVVTYVARAVRGTRPCERPVGVPVLPQGELFGVGGFHAVALDAAAAPDPFRAEVTRLLLAALRRSAERVRPAAELTLLDERLRLLDATPLLYAAPFLHHPFVARDVLKHRAAAVALAQVERTLGAWDRPEHTALLVDRAALWPSFFAPPGNAARAVRKTLALLAEVADPEDLWVLRSVPLGRPLRSALHLQAVAERVRVRRPADDLEAQLRLVEEAPEDELAELVCRVAVVFGVGADPPAVQVHVFAELLANAERPTTARKLRQLVRALMLDHMRPRLSARGGLTAPPPIPPPTAPGVRFLASVDAVLCEGQEMHHCIGTRAAAASRGDAFLFHVERGQERASAEVARDGELVEVSGPCNARGNAACRYARQVLEPWGLLVRVAGVAPAGTCAWLAPAPLVPRGEPLATSDAFIDALRARLASDEDAHALASWLAERLRQAVAGGCWVVDAGHELLALGPDGGVRDVMRVGGAHGDS
ncbi:MAG: PcfJ domain-containing protein [Deltaproteobacteria bacterium]|nr:PcfJ domain-containing protein [Deltaproteobacteria bacterium]